MICCVELEDLIDSWTHQESTRTALVLNQATHCLGLNSRKKQVSSGHHQGGQRRHQGCNMKQRPGVEVPVACIDALQVRHHQTLDQQGVMREQRTIRGAGERCGVQHEDRIFGPCLDGDRPILRIH